MCLPSIMELALCMLLCRQVLGNRPRCVRNPRDDTKGFCCIKPLRHLGRVTRTMTLALEPTGAKSDGPFCARGTC